MTKNDDRSAQPPLARDYRAAGWPVRRPGLPAHPARRQELADFCACDHCQAVGTCLGCTSGICP